MSSYRALLGRSSSWRLIAALSAAWLSFGMVSLALFLTARRATGSYGAAGFVLAAFSVGSALAPLRGRLVDRRGVWPWLPLFGLGYGASLGILDVLATVEPKAWLLAVCAAAAGLSAPPLVATLRGLWSLTVEPELLRPAYALTSLIGDIGLVVAPALGGLLFVVAPWSPLGICGLAVIAGTIIVAHPAARHGPKPDAPGAPTAASGGAKEIRLLLVVSVALGAALGLIEVAVPTAATRWGAESLSGALLGAFALGSVASGLWFGQRNWTRPPEARYLLAILFLALALVLPVLATSPATLAPLLLVVGLGYGPATISLFEVLDGVASANAIEALTWVTTAEAIGAAAGAATSGWAGITFGTWSPFVLASLVLTIPTATALSLRRRQRGRR